MKQKVKNRSFQGYSEQIDAKLLIRRQRYFSDTFKKEKVQDLIEKRISIKEICDLYEVSRASVYKWLTGIRPIIHKRADKWLKWKANQRRRNFYKLA